MTLIGSGELLDLSYAFDDKTHYWPTDTPFTLEVVHRGVTPGGYYYESNRFCAAEHGGTHIDAPAHFARGKWRIDEIPLSVLHGAAVVVDISRKAMAHVDAELEPADLESWEGEHGRIPDGAILLVHTGWGRFWTDRKKYLGSDKPGDVDHLHFPGIGAAAARWLVAERQIKLVGIDTASIDHGPSKNSETHQILLGHGIPALENIAELGRLPATGATVVALPMKIREGSGAPCRIVASVNQARNADH